MVEESRKCLQIKNVFCVLPYLKSDGMNELIFYIFPLEQKVWNETGRGQCRWLCVAVSPASPAPLHVTRSIFQRSLNFHTSVVLPAQLQGPAWPFSSCPVGNPLISVGIWELSERTEWDAGSGGVFDLRVGSRWEQTPPVRTVSCQWGDQSPPGWLQCTLAFTSTLAKPWMTVDQPPAQPKQWGQVCSLKQEACPGSLFRLAAESVTENRHPVE